MAIESFGKNLRFENPATFLIRVTGHIEDSLSDRWAE